MCDSRLLRFVSCLIVAVLGSAAAFSAEQERSIGFVLEMSGSWTINGSALRVGQAVPPGAEIRALRGNTRQASSYVAVVLLDSKVVRVGCTRDKTCDPYKLPTSLVRSSTLIERISEVAMNLFGERPERYTPAITRSEKGALGRQFETVTKLEDGKVGMAPLMHGLTDGEYALSFRHSQETGAGTSGFPVAFQWQSNREEMPVTVDGLSPGLYSVTIRSLADSDECCRTENVWTLLVGAKDFEQVSNDFKRVREGVESWQGVSDAGKRSFLRASLEFLSTQYK